MKQTFIKWLKKLEDFYFLHIRKYVKNPTIECITYFLYALATTNPFVDIQIQWVLTLVINLP
ncbi:MAG: hypothetical protein KHW73_07300 [Clostridium sp.]|jgi:hypothetical protein|nr:hypothetical protein [Clostridium sp.]